MGFNDLVRSMFDGVKDARSDNYERKFSHLNYQNPWVKNTRTPLLDVSELEDLLEHAKTKEHYEAILEHMYAHDATRVKPYKKIEDNIIKHFWED